MRRFPSSTASRISVEFCVEIRRISLAVSSERSWKGDHQIHELLHCIGADRRAVAGLDGLLADLIADFGQHFEAARHAFLHGVQGLRRLV